MAGLGSTDDISPTDELCRACLGAQPDCGVCAGLGVVERAAADRLEDESAEGCE